MYPNHLRDQQTYWTVLGVSRDSAESLFDEYGNLEPTSKAPTIMPYIYRDKHLRSSQNARQIKQALTDDYLPLPTVQWTCEKIDLHIEAYAWGASENSATYLRYVLSNTIACSVSGTFYIAIRPVQINPPWQFGGLSKIESLSGRQTTNAFTIQVNNKPFLLSLTLPDGFGVTAFDRDDIIKALNRDTLPATNELRDTDGLLSGALAYRFNLDPGETYTVILAAPLHENPGAVQAFITAPDGGAWSPDDAFRIRHEELRNEWTAAINKMSISLPQEDVVNTIKSQLGYILINNDADAIQPGSRQYERSWIRDGTMMSEALLRMGLFKQARDFIDWYAHFITPEGMVPPSFRADDPLDSGPGSGIEWDGQGIFIYAVMEYYRFTGDKAFLQKHFENIHHAMQFLTKLRNRTLIPGYMTNDPPHTRYVGILPKSFSHEGYCPEMHSYWDDFWALRGWRDGKEAAILLGQTNIAAWAEEEYQKLYASVASSIRETIACKEIDHIPGCAEKGDFDPTSTSIAFQPCQVADLLPATAVKQTYERYYSNVLERLSPDWHSGFTPYEVRNIAAFVALEQNDRAEFLLNFLMDCRRPPEWNHLAEVVIGDPRTGSYIGDMPHTWVGSGIINAVSRMLVRNSKDHLILLNGAPLKWFSKGKGIILKDQPTHFGKLNLKARIIDKALSVELACENPPPQGYELHWPISSAPSRVTIDGLVWTQFTSKTCRLPPGAKQLQAQW